MNPTKIQTFVQQQVQVDKKARPGRELAAAQERERLAAEKAEKKATRQWEIKQEQKRVAKGLKEAIASHASKGTWTEIKVHIDSEKAMDAAFLRLWDTDSYTLQVVKPSGWRNYVQYVEKSTFARFWSSIRK